ncbi:MAG TPA: TIGR03435 family protein [Acidobacteriaceae bacterium]|nr:TIGR03435 family protein [Acidobacteriaceae bacterium]
MSARQRSTVRLQTCTLWIFLVPLALAQGTPPPAMAPDAKPALDVATIKPSQPDEQRLVYVEGTHLATRATTLVDLMTFAYSVHSLQITGGPQWIRSDRYDVLMQPNPGGRPSTAQMRSIMQGLLADRFQLRLHHASKEMEVYAIVPSKRGPHLAPTTAGEVAANTAAVGFAPGRMTASNASVTEFANLLNRYGQLEWPVVDDTHIPGKFDYKLAWIPGAAQLASSLPLPAGTDPAPASDLFAAIDEQLGLELKARKEPADVLVIDAVEKPSAN